MKSRTLKVDGAVHNENHGIKIVGTVIDKYFSEAQGDRDQCCGLRIYVTSLDRNGNVVVKDVMGEYVKLYGIKADEVNQTINEGDVISVVGNAGMRKSEVKDGKGREIWEQVFYTNSIERLGKDSDKETWVKTAEVYKALKAQQEERYNNNKNGGGWSNKQSSNQNDVEEAYDASDSEFPAEENLPF